jgi:glutamate synthase domain-containing protein 3
MNGATVIVNENGQDNIGNTMNAGKVIVHGHAGDVLGYGMRGGRIHILKDVGYRVGIHMKSYQDNRPVLVAGGKAGDFFGEYMAGGVLVLLGMFTDAPDKPKHGLRLGTGMHGGVIYVRGAVDEEKLSREVGVFPLTPADRKELEGYLKEFCKDFSLDLKEVLSEPFVKILPKSRRPYGNLYCPMPA